MIWNDAWIDITYFLTVKLWKKNKYEYHWSPVSKCSKSQFIFYLYIFVFLSQPLRFANCVLLHRNVSLDKVTRSALHVIDPFVRKNPLDSLYYIRFWQKKATLQVQFRWTEPAQYGRSKLMSVITEAQGSSVPQPSMSVEAIGYEPILSGEPCGSEHLDVVKKTFSGKCTQYSPRDHCCPDRMTHASPVTSAFRLSHLPRFICSLAFWKSSSPGSYTHNTWIHSPENVLLRSRTSWRCGDRGQPWTHVI